VYLVVSLLCLTAVVSLLCVAAVVSLLCLLAALGTQDDPCEDSQEHHTRQERW
jgi:hypothetical protein